MSHAATLTPAVHRNHGQFSCRNKRLLCRCQASEVAVVGGGAAGLTAAYFAARAGAKVVLLEKNTEAGRKILISGGTRCNVLPLQVEAQRDFFTDSSASALRAALASWTLDECHQWLSEKGGIGIRLALEESTSKFFPVSNSSEEVRDRLAKACIREGVQLRYGAGIRTLSLEPDKGWVCGLEGGEMIAVNRVVLATGGKSFPKLGTDGIGYQLAARLGHTLHPPYPALTPLLGTHPGGAQLAGLSLYSAQLTCVQPTMEGFRPPRGGPGSGGEGSGSGRNGQQAQRHRRRNQQRAVHAQRSAMLFTHRGYSGPAILDLSHHVIKEMERGGPVPDIVVDWTGEGPAVWEQRLAGGGAGLVHNLPAKHGIPQRLAEALCVEAGLPADRKVAELRKTERQALLCALTRYRLPITGHEGYAKAEVTGGGVPLKEVNCSTLESRVTPGLHLCGELLDVFGRIGGFNFYWAWVTGRAAGAAAARSAGGVAQGQKGSRRPAAVQG